MSELAKREEEVLIFWNKEKIFEQTLKKSAPKGEYVFYDGPPFANGLPHYGHILASTIKDAIPRYRTMAGYRVARRWGWDCHGLPVENLVEKELGFKNKRDIEAYGIAKFNEAARKSIMKDVAAWKEIIPRLGRWADMEHDYKTMDTTYTESVWWAFKNLYKHGLIYEGFKAMHLCPRCGTTLSNFEVAQGYQDIDDMAVTVKLPLVDEPNTSLLVWTTTAWTLPGNAAAAVNPEATYVKAQAGKEFFIVAKERSAALFETAEFVEEMPGKKLIGKKYLPPFDYFEQELHKHKTHAWKVYGSPHVTMEDGTGIVHIAPAFGAEDLELAQKNKIPLIQHVTEEGKFISTVRDFAGLSVKPKGNPRETDEKIAAALKEKGLLFKEEKIKHSYPHCWRCDTPLLNWAANSWFVKVSSLKSKLLSENKKISWVPKHVGSGRFQRGLESAPDWAISRSRYWGAPLPVWRHTKTKEIKVAGSIEELLSMARRSGNSYLLMRHGEAEHNLLDVISSDPAQKYNLTEAGEKTAREAAEKFKNKKIDIICVSPLLRTQQTARIAAEILGVSPKQIFTDERLQEVKFGELEGRPVDEHMRYNMPAQFELHPRGGESSLDVKRRVGEFLFELESRYTGKNILIVSHGNPLWLLAAAAEGANKERTWALFQSAYPEKGTIRELTFTPYPHNENYELDLHRPYIDEVAMGDTLRGEWKRVPDVFDCWFESGSMPFASNHYPFEKNNFNPKGFLGWGKKGYPAHFIAEGLDQTRGWFYSLLVLGVGLFGVSPYKNVIVNGTIVTQSGEKMSKRLKNYPDPMEVTAKYGADALRYYLLSSSVMRGEDLRFKEQGVDEVSKKLLMRLDNVRSFYDLYASQKLPSERSSGRPPGSTRPFPHEVSATPAHVLDRWILSRLGQTINEMTGGFERYELDVAVRPIASFIDDLSTWYLRRSRERFKREGKDKEEALATLRQVLLTLAKVMAPVMPFFAEDLYRRVRAQSTPMSVHLCDWPSAPDIDEAIIKEMEQVRLAASQGLQLREKEGIKVKQPLAKLSTTVAFSSDWGLAIVADEVNVKEVAVAQEAHLDTVLTDKLREEGLLREYVRLIQDWRKEQKLSIQDRPGLLIKTPEHTEFLKKYREVLMQETGLLSLEVKQDTAGFERL